MDENAHSRALVEALTSNGFDCLTVNEAGMRGASDDEQLAFATSLERAVYTSDMKDFPVVARKWRDAGRFHAGIIMLSDQRTSIRVQVSCMRGLVEAWGQRQ